MHLLNDKKYHLNLDNIVKYCSSSDNDKATQSDITELYRQGYNELELVQKQIYTSNMKNGQLKTIDQYRYDIIKGLLQILFQMGLDTNNGITIRDSNLENLAVGESVVWNTLAAYEFLEETS